MEYNRQKAIDYAHEWAYGRNEKYYDFDPLGGDCTNFISQCLLAGGANMNYTRTMGWYYISLTNRSAAWTGVPFLHNFIVSNKGRGPFGTVMPLENAIPGDIIQLKFADKEVYSHSLMIVAINGDPIPANILIAAHTVDSDNRPLDTYWYREMRLIHIDGVR